MLPIEHGGLASIRARLCGRRGSLGLIKILQQTGLRNALCCNRQRKTALAAAESYSGEFHRSRRRDDSDGKITKDKLKELALENIYGIDKNEEAINISIFSICLTLLDYITPKDIEDFKFPNLKNNNLLVANFFNETLVKNINLDFIIGFLF